MAWRELPDGTRSRLWCILCQENGQAWLAPTPCEHIQEATPEEQISTETAYNTRQELIQEFATRLESASQP